MTTWQEQVLAILATDPQREAQIHQAISIVSMEIANEALVEGQSDGE